MGNLCSACSKPEQNRKGYEPITHENEKIKIPAISKGVSHVEPKSHMQIPSAAVPAAAAPMSIAKAATNKSAAPVNNKTGFMVKYDLKEVIGVGSTSSCHRCLRKADGVEFACKVIDKKQIELKYTGLMDQFNIEIKVLKLLNHPNIIHLADTYETPEKIYMIMEVMKGGELFDYVVDKGTLSEEEASVLVRKITSAVAHMHSLNIIHRDLKPENLLLTSKGPNAEVKLIDFGLAKVMSETIQARSFLGTRGYLAPEMLQRHTYDKAIDIWALGVIVFVLLCGCLPFDDDSAKIESESDARMKFTLRFPRWASNLSLPAKDLLQRLLAVDPKDRMHAEQAMRHPWVVGRAVTPNNYLQSPSILAGKRRDERSPMTPRMQAARAKINMPPAPGASGVKTGYNQSRGGKDNHGRNDANNGSGVVRKNSI
mmetsp:Transcript_17169/g.17248  ORF Transcript_17169/g.17248 Transcript_17169/m.17248 type:complete len:427 (+) Transcript_17169:53-1333(+)